MTPEQEEMIQKSCDNIVKIFSGGNIFGIPIDMNDERMMVVAAFYAGVSVGGEQAMTLLGVPEK